MRVHRDTEQKKYMITVQNRKCQLSESVQTPMPDHAGNHAIVPVHPPSPGADEVPHLGVPGQRRPYTTHGCQGYGTGWCSGELDMSGYYSDTSYDFA